MKESDYSKREIDEKFTHIVDALERIEGKVDYTNGKVKRLYVILTAVGSVVVTLLIVSGSELINFLKILL